MEWFLYDKDLRHESIKAAWKVQQEKKSLYLHLLLLYSNGFHICYTINAALKTDVVKCSLKKINVFI